MRTYIFNIPFMVLSGNRVDGFTDFPDEIEFYKMVVDSNVPMQASTTSNVYSTLFNIINLDNGERMFTDDIDIVTIATNIHGLYFNSPLKLSKSIQYYFIPQSNNPVYISISFYGYIK